MINEDKYTHVGVMTVGELKEVLKDYDDDMDAIVQPCNTNMLGDEIFPEHIIGHATSSRGNCCILVTTIR